MSSEAPKFDPYYKWLGIPRRDQPASHYRLLGIAMYESDAAVIEAAAERQSKFILSCGEKKYPELAQRIVDEIQLARQCLLDPAAKAAYDENLKKQRPKPPVRQPRKTRFDALQVSAVDHTLAAEAEEEPIALDVPDLSSVKLADDHPQQPSADAGKSSPEPSSSQESGRSSKKPRTKAGPRPDGIPAPPMPVAPTEPQPKGTSVAKIVILACILAGGAAAGVVMWLNANSNSAADRPVTASAGTPPNAGNIAKPSTRPSGSQQGMNSKAAVSGTTLPTVSERKPTDSGKPSPTTKASAAATKPARGSASASALPATTLPAAAPTTQPAAANDDDAEEASAGTATQQPPVVFPLRNLQAFRTNWIRGSGTSAMEYEPIARSVLVEAQGEIGGFDYKMPWKELVLTLHAQVIAGQLEIQVNQTTLKFGTSSYMVRRPSTISITYDQANSKLIASVANRQIASAAVTDEKFLSSLNCRVRVENGRTRMRIAGIKIITR